MPINEYICDDCGEPFEKVVRLSDREELPACPECASNHTQKKISKISGLSNFSSGSASSNCAPRGGFG
jgi:putative FmdB family regulatory protein